jgi:SAM-dependent methyltransferase
MALQIPDQFLGRPLVTPELVAAAHAHDLHVHVWTINEPDEIAALLALGVDGVISDFPRARRARGERRAGVSEPSPLVVAHLEALRAAAPLGPVVDLACGRGRNALAIAAHGIPVLGLDRNAGFLDELMSSARERALAVTAVRADLENAPAPPLAAGRCGALVVCRYLHRPLARALETLLAPGGWLLYETFTIHQRISAMAPRTGVSAPAGRAADALPAARGRPSLGGTVGRGATRGGRAARGAKALGHERSSAQRACSASSGSAPSRWRRTRVASDASPELPAATSALRKRPR